jgi:photosystem II stability/assembly factor-like uncharacterized protein
MPQTRVPARRALAAAAVLLALFPLAGARSFHAGRAAVAVGGCPPGYDSGAQQQLHATLERRAEVAGLRPAGTDPRPTGGCRARSAPERPADLLAAQSDSGRRARGGQAAPRRGAYAAAVREHAALATAPRSLAGTAGSWLAVGTTPLIADDQRFGEVNGEGLADLNGRIADFAYDAAGDRLFAAVGEGGVWESDDRGGHWHSIGDSLPTQAVGGIAYAGGTLVIATGDDVFGGGGTFAGLGAFRSTDGGRTWERSTGVPSGVIAFKVAADPVHPGVFYAATGAGLFRSADGGASFTNVGLPTSDECQGASPDTPPCALANMVTDVVVQGPANAQTAGGTPGAVLAAVGWRAADKASAYGYTESPGNGLYRSDDGIHFVKAGAFTPTAKPGRIELGAATGPAQDHRYVYALAEDARKFNGEPPVDQPLNPTGQKVPYPTNFLGVFVSADFGATWTPMRTAEDMVADATSGSALNGTACAAAQYCPGIQSWYNQWIAPDPTSQTGAGVPTRLAFGLEEVWAAAGTPMSGPTKFEVVGPYFSGSTCLFLSLGQECPTTHSDPTQFNTTTHPDQHAGIWLPRDGGATLVAGNDGGVYAQSVGASGAPSPDGWGRGANLGFHTLLPYDAQVASDGTIYAGLQDNGELKIEPDGRQFETFGGDGTYTAVDPDNSDVAYESTPQNAMSKTTDGGRTWDSLTLPDDTYQFANPFQMDPVDASHLLTAGTSVHETTDGGASWQTVFDLGTQQHPGTAQAASATDPDNIVSAVDVRGVGRPLPSDGRPTPDVAWGPAGATTHPDPVGQTAGIDTPGAYEDTPFHIAADEANRSATVTITWASSTDDWDLAVFRSENGTLTLLGTSANGGTTSEQVVLAHPPAGDYVVRARNFTATGTYDGKVHFEAALAGDTVAGGSAAYVAYCGYCDALNTKPFGNGLATNVRPDGTIGKPGDPANWHIPARVGLPKRYITSVQMDPTDARIVYVTLAGYSRRWLRPGVLGPDEGADVGGGHVYRSTDAGEHFTDISGNLPDIPADFTLVRNGQLVVATDLGVYVSADTSGGAYELLGSGLPAVPVLSLELKPKRTATEGDMLVVGTQGRGVYCYAFSDPGKSAAPGCVGTLAQSGAKPPASSSPGRTSPILASAPVACAASRALKTASARGAGRRLKLGFTRTVAQPVTVDVFQVAKGRHVIAEHRVAHFTRRSRGFTWRARVPDGYYFARFRLANDTQRLALRRRHGRWSRRPDYYGRLGCSVVRQFKLLRPVFGGTRNAPLGISVALTAPARVAVTVRRAGKVVKRYRAANVRASRRYTLRPQGLRRGDYRVTIDVRRGSAHVVRTLTSRRL